MTPRDPIAAIRAEALAIGTAGFASGYHPDAEADIARLIALVEALCEGVALLDDVCWAMYGAGTEWLECTSCQATAGFDGERKHAEGCEVAAFFAKLAALTEETET